MELETASREVAVDDPVRVGDVGLRCRRVVLQEVVVVRLQLADQRKRTRLCHLSGERGDLPQRDTDVLASAAWQCACEIRRAANLAATALLGSRRNARSRKRLQC